MQPGPYSGSRIRVLGKELLPRRIRLQLIQIGIEEICGKAARAYILPCLRLREPLVGINLIVDAKPVLVINECGEAAHQRIGRLEEARPGDLLSILSHIVARLRMELLLTQDT